MDYLTKNEVAAKLRVSLPMVKRLIASGANGRPPLPIERFGRCVRIPVPAFSQWIESRPATPVQAKRGRPLGATRAAMKARREAEMAAVE